MSGYLFRRIGQAIVTVLVAVSLIFVAVRMLPNNPVLAKYGQHAPSGEVQNIMAERGWDLPLGVQLKNFLGDLLLRGDLGESFINSGESVTAELLQRVPATIELTLAAMFLALPLGLAAGVAGAVFRGRWPDYLCMAGAMVGVSVPVFFLGICLMAIFPQMPTGSSRPLWMEFEPRTGFFLVESLFTGRFSELSYGLQHICLPAVALSSIPTAIIARITRSSMIEVLGSDYVRTARAKGGSRLRVVLGHALPNAAVPITNIAGFQIGMLLSGAVLTETVFSWRGVGRYIFDAVGNSDYAVIQGGALLVAILFVLMNLVLDLLYAWLDPRVRLT